MKADYINIRYLPIFFSSLIIIILNFFIIKKNFFIFEFKNLKRNLFNYFNIGLGTLFGSIGQWIFFGGERLLLFKNFTENDISGYFIVSQFSLIIYFICLTFSRTYRYSLMKILKLNNYQKLIKFYHNLFFINLLVLVLTFAIFSYVLDLMKLHFLFITIIINSVIFSFQFYNYTCNLYLGKITQNGLVIFFFSIIGSLCLFFISNINIALISFSLSILICTLVSTITTLKLYRYRCSIKNL